MIQCEDCKKEIGSEAKNCIHCGTKTRYGKKEEYRLAGVVSIGLGIGIAILRWTIWPATNLPDSYIDVMTVFIIVVIIAGIHFLKKSKTFLNQENEKMVTEKRLANLIQLKKSGLITEEEFNQKIKRIT